MSDKLLELVFYGELESGADLAKTKVQMAQLFKASEAQIEKMFSGQRVVLKSKLDQATAEKYIAALKARGAACKIEAIGGGAVAPQKPAEPEPEPATTSPAAPAAPAAPATSEPQPVSATSQAFNQSSQPSSRPPSDASFSRDSAAPSAAAQQSPEGALPVAGEKVDEVLAESNLTVEPVGVDLGERHEDAPAPELTMQDSLSIAPVGSDLGQEKVEKEAVVPDTSHLKLDD